MYSSNYKFSLRDKNVELNFSVLQEKDSHVCLYDEMTIIGDCKQYEIDLKILCDNEFVSIGYFIALIKTRDDFSEENGFDYDKYIFRSTKLDDIVLSKNQNLATYIVSIIDTVSNLPVSITKNEYEDFSFDNIFKLKEKKWEQIEYGIFILPEVATSDYQLKNEKIINIRGEKKVFKLLPIGNVNIYKPENRLIDKPKFSHYKEWNLTKHHEKELIYKGNFDECMIKFKDEKELLRLGYEHNKKPFLYDREIVFEDDWRRNYFDTMTDGSLGDYDDFDGDIDDIDTWSRG